MITLPLIITWAAGGAIGATAGFWATRVWKKVSHTQAAVASLQRQLDGTSNEGESL